LYQADSRRVVGRGHWLRARCKCQTRHKPQAARCLSPLSFSGANELSNTVIGRNLGDLIGSSIQLRRGVAVLGFADDMFDELLKLGRV